MPSRREIQRRIVEFLYGPGWVTRSFAWILCIYAVFTAWSIFYDLAYLQLWSTSADQPDFGLFDQRATLDNQIAAIFIMVGLGLVRINWLLSWGYAVLLSNQWLRERPPTPARGAMQTSVRFIAQWNAGTMRSWRGRRPRYCLYESNCLNGGEELGDRVYHCHEKEAQVKAGKVLAPFHLPVYDHYCYWIRVLVYLDSIKPYLLTILFLLVDAVVVLGLSIYALADAEHSTSVLHAPMSALATLITAYLSGVNVLAKWQELAFYNRVSPEKKRPDYLFAIAVGTRDVPDFIFSTYEAGPWDLGSRGNLQEVLGSKWSCFLFWVRPKRVKNYGKNGYLANLSDFQMSADFRSWVAGKRLEHSRSTEATRTARTERGRRSQGRSAESAPGEAVVPDRLELGELTFRGHSRYRLASRSEGGIP
ncbi:hypothetical protein SLS53_004983 [Cytospora paraplurivora]|uniref:Uncharacterized protein n=1 Tax=Cytospora paraplurivora TaxID=2898453 RepID=A0AAN9YGT1_9PEZI